MAGSRSICSTSRLPEAEPAEDEAGAELRRQRQVLGGAEPEVVAAP
jgi:hypothetical protein